MFPLTIFPLPGELVPLHIFEPRYRQLLKDAEERDITFGIYFNHVLNTEKMGSLVKLESVIKRYDSGESDIIVKCLDLFKMATLFRTYKEKPYPGGNVEFCEVDVHIPVSAGLQNEFESFMHVLKINKIPSPCSIYHVANELSLDREDRIRFAYSEWDKKESFLSSRIRFQKHLLTEAERAKDVFHLN